MQANQLILESSPQNESFNGTLQTTELMLNGSLPARRRIELIRLAKREGQLSIAQLSSQFGVSPDTIRRDLDLLSGRGLVRRTHGGAIASDCLVLIECTSPQRLGLRIAEKTRIAQCAAVLIENDESLLLNGGSTTQLFASELVGKKNLTVITNSFGIPPALPPQAVRDIIFIGGQYRPESNTTVGSIAFCGAIPVNADTAIVGVGGIAQDGLYTSLLQDASMTASMIGHARRTIVLADSSKFGRRLLGHIASLNRIDILVTDSAPPRDLMSTLVQLNVHVVVAPPLNSSRVG
ncbi:MAG TPA: DeoR/GlpR family DNA-binding transcription regulator [Chthoniobacterales bacterium]|jgi:DeoR/GlpR family transcriptional regulator of sugar metabolism|nr:DeoR/GlpR family DNA-binding transcription regulator [Chthoniobacterales bacterium]